MEEYLIKYLPRYDNEIQRITVSGASRAAAILEFESIMENSGIEISAIISVTRI